MRALLTALAGLAAVAATPAAAQSYGDNYPVCLQVYGPANYKECRYTSIGQCKMVASGRAAQCIVNPFFVGRQAPGPRRERRARREY